MAEAFARRAGLDAKSAGTTPADGVHSEVVAAMDEVGVDLRHRAPKVLDDDLVEWADRVVTMGCGGACPVLPGKRYVDWELPDPAGAPLGKVRLIRDEIERRVAALR